MLAELQLLNQGSVDSRVGDEMKLGWSNTVRSTILSSGIM